MTTETKENLGKFVRIAKDAKLGEYVVFAPPKGQEGSYLSRKAWYGRNRLDQYNDARIAGEIIRINPKSITIKSVTKGDWNYGHEYKVPKDAQATVDLTEYMKKEVPEFKPIQIKSKQPKPERREQEGKEEEERLNNAVGLHPDYGNWANYLKTQTELKEEKNGYKHYVTSNQHYIVTPKGEIDKYFGYHGNNAFDKISKNPKEYEKEKTEVKQNIRETLARLRGEKEETSQLSVTELERRQAARSLPSQIQDVSQSHQITVTTDSPRVKVWVRDPGSMDIEGIDTPNKQKAGNLKQSRKMQTGKKKWGRGKF